MIASLSWLPFVTLLAPLPPHHGLPGALLKPSFSVRADTTADLGLTPLTEEVLAHYIAVKKDLKAFWAIPANKALHDSANAHRHTRTLTINVPGGAPVPPLSTGVFDYVDLTAHEPAVAAIFQKNNFAPQQFEPTQLAVIRALFAVAAGQATHTTIDAPASVAGKNVALVQPHSQDLLAVGVQVTSNMSGPGGVGFNP